MRLSLDDAISLSYRGATSAPERRLRTKLQPSTTAFGKLQHLSPPTGMLLYGLGTVLARSKAVMCQNETKAEGRSHVRDVATQNFEHLNYLC
jgi:hypothetical protein